MADPAAIIAQLPNPFNELSFLPPELAQQYQISRYVLVGSASVLLWDILFHFGPDLSAMRKLKRKWSLPSITFVFARVLSLSYALCSVIYETASIGQACTPLLWTLEVFYPLAVASTCFLFFLRARAVFALHPRMIVFFFILWLSVLGSNTVVIGALHSINIGPTGYCIQDAIKSYTYITVIFIAVHDTTVMLAVSWKLISAPYEDSEAGLFSQVKRMVRGDGLHSFSKMILKDGQLCWLITVIVNMATLICAYTPTLPVPYRSMLGIPNVVVANIMASMIFRRTRYALQNQNISPATSDNINIPLNARKTATNAHGSRESPYIPTLDISGVKGGIDRKFSDTSSYEV